MQVDQVQRDHIVRCPSSVSLGHHWPSEKRGGFELNDPTADLRRPRRQRSKAEIAVLAVEVWVWPVADIKVGHRSDLQNASLTS